MNERDLTIPLAINIYVAMNMEIEPLRLMLFDELSNYEQQKYLHVARTLKRLYDIKVKEVSDK